MALNAFLVMTNKINGDTDHNVYKVAKDPFGVGINVISWHWGAGRSHNLHQSSGGTTGVANVHDLTVTKYADTATHHLWHFLLTGEHIEAARLILVKDTGQKAANVKTAPSYEYFQVHMEDVIITQVTPQGAGAGDQMAETISLGFARVRVTFTPQDDKGSPLAAMTTEYDIKRGDANVKWTCDGAQKAKYNMK